VAFTKTIICRLARINAMQLVDGDSQLPFILATTLILQQQFRLAKSSLIKNYLCCQHARLNMEAFDTGYELDAIYSGASCP